MFLFRLALALGCTVGELEHRLSAAELAEWRAYSQIEPFGERRADQRAWLAVAALLNVHRDAKKAKAIELHKILPEWQAPPDPMAAWRAFAVQMEQLDTQ